MSRYRYRQVFLFLMVLVLPTLAIGWQGLKLVNQERDLDRGRAEKQAEDLQESLAEELGRNLFARLEQIKIQEMANSPAAIPQPGTYSDPAVVLVGRAEGDRLAWPWDEDKNGVAAVPQGDETEFDQKKRTAERVEFGEKNYERAAALYRSLADTARSDSQRATARLALARTLRQTGAQAEAIGIYRELLNLPWNVTDDLGDSIAKWAAASLIKANASRDVLNRVKRELGSSSALGPRQEEQLKAVLETLSSSTDRAVRDEVGPALDRLSVRVRDMEKARSLKEARNLQLGFAGLGATALDWKPYPGPGNELWLVGRAPEGEGASPAPLVVVVRADAIQKSWPKEFHIAAGGDSGLPLGEHLPGLRVIVPPGTGAPVVAESNLLQSFYGLSLFVVVPLTFLGGYMLWRDTRRESRVAEMRSQFVSSVSHELKTPLTSIRMFAETLQMADETDSSDPKIRAEYLDTIVSESERLTRLLNNVLDFSRIERGQKSYHMESADLPEVVDAAVKTMRFPLAEQGFDLRVDIAEGLPSLHIDRDAIEQAVLNLLSNAMKYSGKSKDIELRLSRQNGSALIQVSDHGIGIPPIEQRRIFDRFYRVPSKENRAISGTGLGLALVAHIAEAHGGSVDVKSEPGEGSTFSIRIPVNGSHHS